MNKTLITIVGPTAIGKTSQSIEIAKHFKTEILSADSRQFFKEMTIGTAVPSEVELNEVTHHFIQNLSIKDDYDVGKFERDALLKIEELFKQHDTLVMVGGSGLYIDAVLYGLNDFPEIDPKIREELNSELQENGLESLQQRLKLLDFETFEKIDIQNPHRVIRALEVCEASGNKFSNFVNRPKPARPFHQILIGLTADRNIVYDRINTRVDLMIADGLVEEVKELYQFKDYNALNTVGYKEIFRFLDKEYSLEEAVSEVKKNTRRFAKRQLTWFKKNNRIKWYDYQVNAEEVISDIDLKIEKENIS
ncbi:tRNA dimethylallyltransferase [Flavobacteriaceae bacterium MAR_2010_188]|nr:tRNA dimethylallyltransferase [Flavobacteriaceae bacterium MAR_2010_188]